MSAAPVGKKSAVAAGKGKESASASSQVEPPPWESPQWQEAVSQNPGLSPFFDNLESFVELPEGVEKLRELMLDLAVRGKLISQDPNDEAASFALERIAEEVAVLVKAKEIPKPKPLPPIKEDEESVPLGWATVRAGQLLTFVTSGSRGWAKYYSDDGPIFLRIGNLDYATTKLDLSSLQRVTPPDTTETKRTAVRANDILISVTGDTGMVGLIPQGFEAAHINQHIALTRPSKHVDPEYLATFFTSRSALSQLHGAQRGIKNSLGLEDVRRLQLMLPPLAEQRRIVSKVEGLMSLCDTLESQRRSRESVRERASRSVLASLTSASAPLPAGTSRETSTGETLKSSWQRLSDHFEVLLDQPSGPAHLRQSILQLAVQGKLVPQDPNDEPATVDSLGNLLRENSLNGYSKKPSDTPEGTQVLRISAGTSRGDFYVEETDHKWSVLTDAEREKFNLQKDDLLACRFNGNLHYVGKFSLYRNELGTEQIYPDKLIRFRVDLERLVPRYAAYALNAQQSREKIESFCATTAGNIGISATNLKTIEMLVPPLAEQKRIVSKVSVLLSQLDELSARLRSRQSNTDALLTALIHQILEGTE